MPKLRAAGLVAAALVLILNGLSLGSAIYSRYAEERLGALPDARAERASAIAAALAPWSAPPRALQGWIFADAGEGAAANALYQAALRRAPADGLLWAEYALALGRDRAFDQRLALATRRAMTLAPASAAVRQSVARMALRYWRLGNPELQDLWRQALRWQLDHNRDEFLRAIDAEGYRAAFCAQHASELAETAWCGATP